MRRQVIYLAHYFPPTGGGGVQRSLKFVKYLPGFGYDPLVLTGPGPAKMRWEPEDRTLLDELPASLRIYRGGWGSSGRGTAAFFGSSSDRQKALVRLGVEAAQANGAKIIVVSMCPYQDSLIAAKLAKALNIPWVADLRDPWALAEAYVFRTRWHRQWEMWRMAQRLRSAALVILNTPEAVKRFRAAFPSLLQTPVASLTNGYDAEDFAAPTSPRAAGRFVIVHCGYLHTRGALWQQRRSASCRLLGRLVPGVNLLGRTHHYLLQALEQWQRENPAIMDTVRVVLVGDRDQADEALVANSSVRNVFEFTGYLPHLEALARVRAANLLFLPMYGLPPGRRASIVPGKTYEYMASGQPILAALPAGDARDFVSQAGNGFCCAPDDVRGMLNILKARYACWRRGEEAVPWQPDYVQRFERRELTRQLAQLLDGVMGSRGHGPAGERLEEMALAGRT